MLLRIQLVRDPQRTTMPVREQELDVNRMCRTMVETGGTRSSRWRLPSMPRRASDRRLAGISPLPWPVSRPGKRVGPCRVPKNNSPMLAVNAPSSATAPFMMGIRLNLPVLQATSPDIGSTVPST
jgi:hypothetical protein